jgi:hypothetical protein
MAGLPPSEKLYMSFDFILPFLAANRFLVEPIYEVDHESA